MQVYLLKRDSVVYQIQDQKSLEKLVRLSLIVPTERLKRSGESRYRAAKSFPELKALFAMDAWDTWDELGDDDPDDVWKQSVVILSESTVPPHGEDKPDGGQDLAVNSVVVTPQSESESAPVLEESIVFPSKKQEEPGSDIAVPAGSEQWHPPTKLSDDSVSTLARSFEPSPPKSPSSDAIVPNDVFIHQALSSTKKKPPRRFSTVFILFSIIGVVVLVLLQYTIRNTAQWNSVANTRISRIDRDDDLHNYEGDLAYGRGLEGTVEEGVSAEPAVEADQEEQDQESTVLALDSTVDETQILIRTLRSQISGPPREMRGQDDDLTTALMLDLSRLRGRVDRIRAPVTLWGGAESNIPLEASINIWLHSSGDVLRDVAIVSLAVSRVIQYHDTVVTGFYLTLVAENGPPRRMALSGLRASEFYQNQITFSEFIADL